MKVKDLEFDLLLHILYKYDFDKGEINQEINWICESIQDSDLKTFLLQQSLRQFSSELSNKILAKSISESISHRKIVEDMLLDINRVQYSLAEKPSDLRKILELRKKIFVREEGYPIDAMTNGFEKDSLHLMATIHHELVGCVSLSFDGPDKKLPLDHYLALDDYKLKKNVEIDKLAVIGDKRKRELSFQLMWLCYSVCRFWGAERMFIFTLSKKEDNLLLYKRFGFKQIKTFVLFDNEEATALMLDFDDIDTYEKKLKSSELLRIGKKLLKRFIIQHPS